MTVNEMKKKILSLDPHNVVSCDLDDFSPYLVISLPSELEKEMESLTTDQEDEVREWMEDLLESLRSNGSSGWR